MMKLKVKHRLVLNQIIIYLAFLLLLFLTSLNIHELFEAETVLGTETSLLIETDQQTLFWENFLKENPEYIPGWIELGRTDKVLEIDPNYFLHSSI